MGLHGWGVVAWGAKGMHLRPEEQLDNLNFSNQGSSWPVQDIYEALAESPLHSINPLLHPVRVELKPI